MDSIWSNKTFNIETQDTQKTLDERSEKDNHFTSLKNMAVGMLDSRRDPHDNTYDVPTLKDSKYQSADLRDWTKSYRNQCCGEIIGNTSQTSYGERYKISRISNTSSSKHNNTYYVKSSECVMKSSPRENEENKWLVTSASQCHVTLHSGNRHPTPQHTEENSLFSGSDSPKYSIRSRVNSTTKSAGESDQSNMEFKVVLKRETRNIPSPIVYKKLKWQCTFCGESQATKLSLITHIKSHLQPFCKLCLKIMGSKEQLINHMENKHQSSSCEDEDQPGTQFVTSKYGRRRRVFSTSALLPKRKYDIKK